jgi:hypothetical protein
MTGGVERWTARPRTLGPGALVFVVAVGASTLARAADETAAPPPAGDGSQEARHEYQAGMQAYEAKRFVEAALHFEAAVIQRPHAVAVYTAALAWEEANRPERAADDFARALDVPGLSQTQAANARERLTTLEKAMGTLDVTAPDGWRVQLDENTSVLAPAHLHAMPGVHSLAVQSPSAPIRHRDVLLELGRTTRLALTAEPPPAPPPIAKPEPAPALTAPPGPSPATSSGIDLRRSLGFAAAGAGIASIGAGVVLGVSALSARDAYNAAPTLAAYNHATGLQTWTDVAFIAGGALAVGGAALILWPSPRAKGEPALSVAPAPGGFLVRGAF